MLELPSVELPQRINEELQENPALVEGPEEVTKKKDKKEGRDENEQEGEDEYGQESGEEHGKESEDEYGKEDKDEYEREYEDEYGDEYEDEYGKKGKDDFEREGEDGYERDDYGNNRIEQNEDFDYDQYASDDETPSYMLRSNNGMSENDGQDIAISGGTSFLEELKAQVYLTKMTKPQRHIAKWVLGNIDDDGYLRRTVEQLVDDLSFQEGLTVTDEEMTDIVNQIKQFDPPGVAAANLQECLLTQLKRKTNTPAVALAIKIIENYLEPFSKHHFDKVMQRLGVSEAQFKEAVDEILRLNQKPANAFTGNVYEMQRSAIIPDFFVENREGELILTLNTGDIPELHVSRKYSEMLQEYSQEKLTAKSKETVRFIRNKIDAARWFIDAIRQRNETLTRTMTAIMQFQQEFFLEGDETQLRPMILQDIAEKTGYDVSTISRVSNSKYVQTQFGIYPLKYFFSESMTNSQGEEVSTREIKHILQEIISNEDKTQPLNDDRLVEMLSERGYVIARRTIAKYREQLGIPVARLRRKVVS